MFTFKLINKGTVEVTLEEIEEFIEQNSQEIELQKKENMGKRRVPRSKISLTSNKE